MSGVRREIVCVICHAAFAPAQGFEYLLSTPSQALESALMSMCHFCFRCRRPSCPACWDNVNGVCGSCAQEAHLPFRSEAPLLRGVLFVPSENASQIHERSTPPPLLCVREGRFQAGDSAAPAQIDWFPEPESATQSEGLPGVTIYESVQPIARLASPVPMAASSAHSSVAAALDELPTRPARARGKRRRRFLVALALLLIVLLAVIVLALLSIRVNAALILFLHIDIRASIAYIIHFIQHTLLKK